MNRFYVYAFLREDGSPYYIGKGTGKRIYQNTNRRGTKRPVNGGHAVKIKDNMTEEDAFSLEKVLIEFYGRESDGGILHNFSKGGRGGNNNGPKLTEEHKTNIGRSCRYRIKVKGIEFDSITDATLHFGVRRSTIWNWQQKGLAVRLSQ